MSSGFPIRARFVSQTVRPSDGHHLLGSTRRCVGRSNVRVVPKLFRTDPFCQTTLSVLTNMATLSGADKASDKDTVTRTVRAPEILRASILVNTVKNFVRCLKVSA